MIWETKSAKGLKWKRSRRSMVIGLVVSCCLFLGAFSWTVHDGLYISTVQLQQLDAISNLRTETALGHLWFEENLEGDKGISIEDIWLHFDRACEYALVLHEGGEIQSTYIQPLVGEKLLGSLEILKNQLSDFRVLAQSRYDSLDESGVGSKLDQEFDSSFDSIIKLSEDIEGEVRSQTNTRVSAFRINSGLSLLGTFLLVLSCGIWLRRYEGQRTEDFKTILHAEEKLLQLNEELSVTNEELNATNEELTATNEELEAQYEELAASNQEVLDTQEALRESEERFDLALTVSNDGMWDWDMAADTTYFDARYYTMAGYEPNEFPSTFQEWIERVHTDDQQAARDGIESHRSGKTPTFISEFRFQHKNGQWIWIKAKGQIVARAENGDPLRMVGTHSDITLRKHAEEEQEKLHQQLLFVNEKIRATNEELVNSNKELEDFAYIASHDLKEPLRGISNYSTFLLEDYAEKLDAEGLKMLQTLPRLTKRLEELIDELLKISRIGRVDLAFGDINLDNVVDEVIESLHIVLEEDNIEIRRHTTLPIVRCDRVRVSEVFRNLITNAMKYNDKTEKWIEIGYRQEFPEVEGNVYFVSDNGIGIPKRHIDKVFTMFKRLHARDKFGGGTGAGMTIVKKIVERHEGQIWIDSEVGKGTVFNFTLGRSK